MVHEVETTEKLSQVVLSPLVASNGLRNCGSSAIPTKEASDVPEDPDGKGPGTELISLQTSRVQNDLSARRTSRFEELLERQLIVAVERIGSVSTFKLDEHFHPLERSQTILGVACVCVVESDVWLVF